LPRITKLGSWGSRENDTVARDRFVALYRIDRENSIIGAHNKHLNHLKRFQRKIFDRATPSGLTGTHPTNSK
jgi:hypothetical protein